MTILPLLLLLENPLEQTVNTNERPTPQTWAAQRPLIVKGRWPSGFL